MNNIYDFSISTTTDINLMEVFKLIIIPLSIISTIAAVVIFLFYNYYNDKIKKGDNTLENQKMRDDYYIAFITLICFATIPFFLMICILCIMKYKAILPSVSSIPAPQTAIV
jgi:C4-dicarboxylate transporter